MRLYATEIQTDDEGFENWCGYCPQNAGYRMPSYEDEWRENAILWSDDENVYLLTQGACPGALAELAQHGHEFEEVGEEQRAEALRVLGERLGRW